MKTPTLFLFIVAALFIGATGSKTFAQFMEAKEYSAEIDSVDFGNAPTAGGLVYVKRCDQCAVTGVTFHSQTRFFDGDRVISADAAEKLGQRGATLLFDPETRYVTRVVYWSEEE